MERERGVPCDEHFGDVLETSVEDGTPDVDLEPGFEVLSWRHVADFIKDNSKRESAVAETRGSYTNKEDRAEWTQAWSPCSSLE